MTTVTTATDRVPTKVQDLAQAITPLDEQGREQLLARLVDQEGQARADRLWTKAAGTVDRAAVGQSLGTRKPGRRPVGDGPKIPPKWRPGPGQWSGLEAMSEQTGETITDLVRRGVGLLLDSHQRAQGLDVDLPPEVRDAVAAELGPDADEQTRKIAERVASAVWWRGSGRPDAS